MGLGDYLSGIVGADSTRRAQQTAAQGQIDAITGAQGGISDAWNAQQGMWSPIASNAGSAIDKYSQAANSDYWKQDPEKFQFNGDIKDYLDPSMDFRMQRGTGALDASAAAQGGLFSSGHGMAVQDYAQNLASTEYGKAFDRMQTTRNNAYQQYSDFLQNQQARRTGQLNAYKGQADIGMQGLSNLSQQRGNYDQSNIQNRMDLVNAYAGKEANRQGNENLGWQNAAGALGSGVDMGAQAGAAYLGAGG